MIKKNEIASAEPEHTTGYKINTFDPTSGRIDTSIYLNISYNKADFKDNEEEKANELITVKVLKDNVWHVAKPISTALSMPDKQININGIKLSTFEPALPFLLNDVYKLQVWSKDKLTDAAVDYHLTEYDDPDKFKTSTDVNFTLRNYKNEGLTYKKEDLSFEFCEQPNGVFDTNTSYHFEQTITSYNTKTGNGIGTISTNNKCTEGVCYVRIHHKDFDAVKISDLKVARLEVKKCPHKPEDNKIINDIKLSESVIYIK